MIFPKFFLKKNLGIDIGTTAIKLVELSSWRGKRKLENYGEKKTEAIFEKPFQTFKKNTLSLSTPEVAKAIKAVMKEAKIKTRQCVFSIPDFSSFFTTFELPPLTKEELSQAVVFEARKHIPLPLGEVTLDWQVIEGKPSNKIKSKLKILLVAVPNEVINQYQEIAQLTNLQILALEAEVFGLVRSLIPAQEEKTLSIVDIGAQSTTCSIVDKKVLKISHSFKFSGNELTEVVAKSLSLDYKTAERIKEKCGLKDIPLSSVLSGSSLPEKSIRAILLPLINSILREIEEISRNFYQTEGKEIQKFIITGGTALTPGLREYFKKYLKKEVEIANPFSKVFYPPILEDTLKKLGPSYVVAVGMALRNLK